MSIKIKKLVFFLIVNFFNVDVTSSLWSASVNGIFRGTHVIIQPALQENLAHAVQLALDHCESEFKWDRWNCPENVFSRKNRALGSQSTKEFAYVLAITSAAVVHVVTKNCSSGNIQGCGCNPDLNGPSAGRDWIWGGCSDHVEYGESISKKYLDSMESGIDPQTYTNLHNYGVGREIVKRAMKKHCKCHGMSGSCTVKSCWMQLPTFKDVAYQLRQHYDRAVRVDFEEGEGKVVIGNSVSGNTLKEIPKARNEDLVFLQESPNYCLANNTTGWTGTKGRTCSRAKGESVTDLERRSCRHLCRKCGHDVRRKKRTVVRHCKCSFEWCCNVKCSVCTETVVEHFCS